MGRCRWGSCAILTDEGIEGNGFLSLPGPGPAEVGSQIVTFLRPLLLGEDALDIGRLWHRAAGMGHFVGPHALGSVDVALWDIAGKAAGLPIHRLLGTCRDERAGLPLLGAPPDARALRAGGALLARAGLAAATSSTPRAAPGCRGRGCRSAADIDACAAVREACGDEMTLMLDSSWDYSYSEALRVGRAIEELGYHWYEDPLPPHDLHGYLELRRHLDIPLLATETTLGGLYTLPQWITPRATDFLRGDVVIKGGITGLIKIAHLAEAFNMNCEVHDGYNALGNVANLHVVMAIRNCDWFEVLPFNRPGDHSLEHLSYGLVRAARDRRRGPAARPHRPGAGRRDRLGADRQRAQRRARLISLRSPPAGPRSGRPAPRSRRTGARGPPAPRRVESSTDWWVIACGHLDQRLDAAE